jgi:amidase
LAMLRCDAVRQRAQLNQPQMHRDIHYVWRIAVLCVVSPAVAALGAQARRAATRGDIAYEANITDLQAAMASGRTSSVALVDAYLARIRAYDHAGPALNAVIRLNPQARADAAARDRERRQGIVRGPLHGIPIILKDNYATRGMPTEAASIALAGLVLDYDAFQVQRLREGGAVILGKSNMNELAAGISGLSSLGGQTCNPYNPDRNPGGSSGGSGAAVAASFAVVAWGSDTCGSIRIPSAVQNLFGLRPTKGLSSVHGIVPLSHSQDVAGPLARSVMDLAIALDATVGPDPTDPATRILNGRAVPQFVRALDTTALRGKRFAVLTSLFGTDADDQEAALVVRSAIARLRVRGATAADVVIAGLDTLLVGARLDDFEVKDDLGDFFATLSTPHVASLADLLARGLYSAPLEGAFRRRDSLGTRDNAAYRAARARGAAARALVTEFMDENHYDALIYPTMRRKAALIGEPTRGATCELSAVTGLPAISMPAGFTPDGMPIGVELLGRSLADTALVAMAFDYEQATHPRRAPATTPALVDGRRPPPRVFTVSAASGGAVARGTFVFDPTRRTLQYELRISGASPEAVFGASITRDSAGAPAAIVHQLSRPEQLHANGTLILRDDERVALLEGRWSLTLFAGSPLAPAAHGALRVSPIRGGK